MANIALKRNIELKNMRRGDNENEIQNEIQYLENEIENEIENNNENNNENIKLDIKPGTPRRRIPRRMEI